MGSEWEWWEWAGMRAGTGENESRNGWEKSGNRWNESRDRSRAGAPRGLGTLGWDTGHWNGTGDTRMGHEELGWDTEMEQEPPGPDTGSGHEELTGDMRYRDWEQGTGTWDTGKGQEVL